MLLQQCYTTIKYISAYTVKYLQLLPETPHQTMFISRLSSIFLDLGILSPSLSHCERVLLISALNVPVIPEHLPHGCPSYCLKLLFHLVRLCCNHVLTSHGLSMLTMFPKLYFKPFIIWYQLTVKATFLCIFSLSFQE